MKRTMSLVTTCLPGPIPSGATTLACVVATRPAGVRGEATTHARVVAPLGMGPGKPGGDDGF